MDEGVFRKCALMHYNYYTCVVSLRSPQTEPPSHLPLGTDATSTNFPSAAPTATVVPVTGETQGDQETWVLFGVVGEGSTQVGPGWSTLRLGVTQ